MPAWSNATLPQSKSGISSKYTRIKGSQLTWCCCTPSTFASCSDVSGTVFIRTDQLDGETDWKLRKPIPSTQAHVAAKKNLRLLAGSVRADPPNNHIYKFIAEYEADNGQVDALDLENTMWANTVLCSGKILGLVMYTGRETRMSMNSKESREKRGSLDLELNILSKYLFVAMTLASFLIVLASGTATSWFQVLVLTVKFILLTSSIIPISLRVNLDFSKIVFSYKISNDVHTPDALARNSEIPEELGRIQFILSDKTGTLTQNEMVFKNLSLEQIQFKDEDIDVLRKILQSECSKFKGPMADIWKRIDEGKGKNFRRESDKVVRDILTAIAVCHNVTPVDEDGVKTYQASSPDEVALVKLAESVGMSLEFRDQKTMKIRNALSQEENYEILENFPFSSETKRMGIVLRQRETKRLIFYLKGADVALIHKVPEIQKGFLADECENLAREGLRTLVIAQKPLTEEEYQAWKKKYHEAQISSNREENSRTVIESLEKNMELLGITGVEDKLQEDVRVSIESIRNAGIQFWMLTGDKIETACCIAISTSLKTPNQDFFIMRVCLAHTGHDRRAVRRTEAQRVRQQYQQPARPGLGHRRQHHPNRRGILREDVFHSRLSRQCRHLLSLFTHTEGFHHREDQILHRQENSRHW